MKNNENEKELSRTERLSKEHLIQTIESPYSWVPVIHGGTIRIKKIDLCMNFIHWLDTKSPMWIDGRQTTTIDEFILSMEDRSNIVVDEPYLLNIKAILIPIFENYVLDLFA